VVQKWRLHRRQIGWRALLVGSIVFMALALLRLVGGTQALIAMGIAGTIWPLALGWFVWTAPARAVSQLKAAGFLPLGPTTARFDASGVYWRHEGSASQLAWPAIVRMFRDRRGLWLHLSSAQALFVPNRALCGTDLSTLAGWRQRPSEVAELRVPVGCDTWVLDGDLDVEDWMLAVERVSRSPGWRRWLIFARFPVFLAAIAMLFWASGLPVGRDFWLFGAAAVAWIALATAFAPRLQSWALRLGVRREPARVPVGRVSWRIGPAGLWMRTSRGTTWFSWSWIGSVVADPEGVTLVVGRTAVIAVPNRLIPRTDSFVAACSDWSASSARLRGGAPVPGRGKADDSNPFAPTDS
jgi:hypothetical protein